MSSSFHTLEGGNANHSVSSISLGAICISHQLLTSAALAAGEARTQKLNAMSAAAGSGVKPGPGGRDSRQKGRKGNVSFPEPLSSQPGLQTPEFCKGREGC
jgi:hypothetical protein